MEKKTMNGIILAIVAMVVVALVIVASMGLMGTKSGETSAKLDVLSISVDRHDVLVNDSVTVTVRVSNTGTVNASKTLDLLLDGSLSQSKNVSLGPGKCQNVSFTIKSTSEGNHTLKCGSNDTTFISYPRWRLGDYLTYRFVSTVEPTSNMTMTVIGISGPNITVLISFDGGPRENSTSVINSSFNAYALLTNISMVGKVMVPTNFGDKMLNHYNRSDPGPMYDVYMDESSLLVFKQVTNAWPFVITEELIGTNMPWVHDLAKA